MHQHCGLTRADVSEAHNTEAHDNKLVFHLHYKFCQSVVASCYCVSMLQKIQKETLEVKIGECSVCMYCVCKCVLGGCRGAEVSLQGHTSLFQKLSERGVGCWTDRYKGTCVGDNHSKREISGSENLWIGIKLLQGMCTSQRGNNWLQYLQTIMFLRDFLKFLLPLGYFFIYFEILCNV